MGWSNGNCGIKVIGSLIYFTNMISSLLKYNNHFYPHILVVNVVQTSKTKKSNGKWKKKKKKHFLEKKKLMVCLYMYTIVTLKMNLCLNHIPWSISLDQHNIYFSIFPVQELGVMLDEHFSMDLIWWSLWLRIWPLKLSLKKLWRPRHYIYQCFLLIAGSCILPRCLSYLSIFCVSMKTVVFLMIRFALQWAYIPIFVIGRRITIFNSFSNFH